MLLLATEILSSPLTNPAMAAVGPHAVTLTMLGNSCSGWSGNVTFEAVELTQADINNIRSYGHYDFIHLHDSGGSFSYATYKTFSSSDFASRLAQINNLVFGTNSPVTGQIAVKNEVHSGSCAADDGGFECVGVLVGPRDSNLWNPSDGTPPTVGGCFRVPPAAGSCWFMTRTNSKELGTIQNGAASSVTLGYQCQGTAPDYEVSLAGGGSSVRDDGGKVSVEIKVGGQQLPYTLAKPAAGARELKLDLQVAADPSASGKFSAYGVLMIEPK